MGETPIILLPVVDPGHSNCTPSDFKIVAFFGLERKPRKRPKPHPAARSAHFEPRPLTTSAHTAQRLSSLPASHPREAGTAIVARSRLRATGSV
jgi:hypothetical protein